jgi:hypothetical protein
MCIQSDRICEGEVEVKWGGEVEIQICTVGEVDNLNLHVVWENSSRSSNGLSILISVLRIEVEN